MTRSLKHLSLVAVVLCLSVTTWACPDFLNHFHTKFLKGFNICAAHDRYQTALQSLRIQKRDMNPERIENLRAPRFINLPDWEHRKADLAAPSALYVYNPAPLTWLMWDAGAQVIDSDAARNFASQKMGPLTLDWLKTVHGTSLNGLIDAAGRFRSAGEFGLMINHQAALTMAQLENAINVEYPLMLNHSKKLVTFTPIECIEEAPPEFLQRFLTQDRNHLSFDIQTWPHNAPLSFKTLDGTEKQCGYFTYAPIEEMIPQMSLWLHYINKVTGTWGTSSVQGDPIFVAARAQRWLISIHPYEHGNGRMSRLVMDWILESLGLPAPILKDQNDDLYSTERQWDQEVGNGVLRAIDIAEHCALQPTDIGCDIIPQSQAGVSP